MLQLPEIPKSWLIVFIFFCLILLRFFSIDSWITATLSMIIGYIIKEATDTNTKLK